MPEVKEKSIDFVLYIVVVFKWRRKRREGEEGRRGAGEGIERGSRGRKEEEVDEGMRESTA